MTSRNRRCNRKSIIEKSRAFGASLAGIASVRELISSPSHTGDQVVSWPNWARSVLVLALAHPADKPELDWWDGKKGTPGNRILIQIADEMVQWLKQECSIRGENLMYHVENGGIYLKDAAVLAGLGVIGKNNLFVTPEFGPRVRLRVLLLDEGLEPTDPIVFDPCSACERPCITACPQNAFENGFYKRERCNRQMEKNRAKKEILELSENGMEERVRIKYCRVCERACPIGG